MKTNTIVFALLLILVSFETIIAQTVSKEPKYYNWFDNQVKLYNTGLFNGTKYIELFRTINEKHKFFKTSEFQQGSIVYDGQFYDQIPLKYDLHTDELLLNIGYNYQYPTLILFKSKVEQFTIGNSHFVQIVNTTEKSKVKGFYEVLFEGDSLTLLKKNKKKGFKRIKGSTVYYEFIPEDSYLVKNNGEFHHIENKQDIVRIWPSKREFINENYNQALKKANTDVFWINLFSKLSDSFTLKNQGQNP